MYVIMNVIMNVCNYVCPPGNIYINDVILMLILPHIFKWFFDIYIYIYIYIYNICICICIYIYRYTGQPNFPRAMATRAKALENENSMV